jgi:AcrR family transcriptional regulator
MRIVRLTREAQKADTRARLIECARRVFLDNGFHAATLEQIALEAGVTKGAVYSNFDSKADLFLAVSGTRMEQRLEGYQRAGASATRVEALVREFVRIMMSHDPDGRWASVVAEAWAVAASDEPFRLALIEQSARGNAVIMRAIEDLAERAGVEFLLPMEKMDMLCVALVRGMFLQRLLDPARVTKERIEDTLIAVIHGLARPRAGSTQRRAHDEHLAPRPGGRAAARRRTHRPR